MAKAWDSDLEQVNARRSNAITPMVLTRLQQRIGRAIFQPRGPESGEVFLNQRRVFILPTRAGLLLGATLVALLLGSINYSLSLGFALTFLVAGIAWVAMFHTFRNLAHLHLRCTRVEPVFAGEIAQFRVVLANRNNYDRYALRVQADEHLPPAFVDVMTQAEAAIMVPVTTYQRGMQRVPRMTLETVFPLGVWRAWSYWQPSLEVLCYPTPAPADQNMIPLQCDGSDGEGHPGSASEDFAGIREYQKGDGMRRLAWKAMARSPQGIPMSKTFDGGRTSQVWLDLAMLPANFGREAALSQLTRWVLDCENTGVRYGLRLPTVEIRPARGDIHRERCLTLLALVES